MWLATDARRRVGLLMRVSPWVPSVGRMRPRSKVRINRTPAPGTPSSGLLSPSVFQSPTLWVEPQRCRRLAQESPPLSHPHEIDTIHVEIEIHRASHLRFCPAIAFRRKLTSMQIPGKIFAEETPSKSYFPKVCSLIILFEFLRGQGPLSPVPQSMFPRSVSLKACFLMEDEGLQQQGGRMKSDGLMTG